MVRNTVELYAKGGGFYASIHSQDPKQLWELITELYAYSREYYDREQGAAEIDRIGGLPIS
jgi:hypothetical protein